MHPLYVDKVRAFLRSNKLVFSRDSRLASRTYYLTVPRVDVRSLIFAPAVDVEDVVRDAILVKYLAGTTDPDAALLERVQSAYMSAKQYVSDAFVIRLREVFR